MMIMRTAIFTVPFFPKGGFSVRIPRFISRFCFGQESVSKITSADFGEHVINILKSHHSCAELITITSYNGQKLIFKCSAVISDGVLKIVWKLELEGDVES